MKRVVISSTEKAGSWQHAFHRKWGTVLETASEFYNTNLKVIMLNSGPFPELIQEVLWPFWNVRVLGKEKSWNFHVRGKSAPSQLLKKKFKILFTKEKEGISCNFTFETSTWIFGRLKWQSTNSHHQHVLRCFRWKKHLGGSWRRLESVLWYNAFA